VHYIQNKYLIIIVDDGSDKPILGEELNRLLPSKYPLQIITMPHNAGITDALNTGLQWIDKNCDTLYIARLDAGDICHPKRFFFQVEEMQKNDTALLCGTWCKFMSNKNNFNFLYKTPIYNKDIQHAMYFRNVFIHPTVMFKKNVIALIGLYPDNFPHTEDYAYFWNIIKIGTSFIIPKILVTCEINQNGISLKNRKVQLKSRMKIVKKIGKNPYRKIFGIIKLQMLLIIPNVLILKLKKLAR
jgi:glycosyltransferase involved in cell wall biosynthesis